MHKVIARVKGEHVSCSVGTTLSERGHRAGARRGNQEQL